MDELIEKVDLLKKELDKNKDIQELKNLNKKIKDDKELLKLIEEYNETRNEEIKEKIKSNELYSKYKHLETEINFLILKIRSELKTINNRSGCVSHESN